MSIKTTLRFSPEKHLRITCEDDEDNPLHMKFVEGVPTEEAEDAVREAIENLGFKFHKEYNIVDDLLNCRSINPLKESLIKKGSIYLGTKETIQRVSTKKPKPETRSGYEEPEYDRKKFVTLQLERIYANSFMYVTSIRKNKKNNVLSSI